MERPERRVAQRVSVSKPLLVLGTDSHGKSFSQETVSINMSSSGIYFALDQPVDEHAILDVSIIEKEGQPSTCLRARGRVVRREAVMRHELSGSEIPTTHLAVQFHQSVQLSINSPQSSSEASVSPLKMAVGAPRSRPKRPG